MEYNYIKERLQYTSKSLIHFLSYHVTEEKLNGDKLNMGGSEVLEVLRELNQVNYFFARYYKDLIIDNAKSEFLINWTNQIIDDYENRVAFEKNEQEKHERDAASENEMYGNDDDY